jgi:hypothetical protein
MPSQPAYTDGSNSSKARSQISAANASPPITTTTPSPAATPPTLPSDGPVAAQQAAKPDADDRYAAPSASANTSLPKPAASDSANASTPVAPPPRTNPDAHPQPAVTPFTPPASKAFNSRQAAWILGSRLSLAALANDRQLAAKNVPVWFADAQSAAKSLDTTASNLPSPATAESTSNASKQVLDYLLVNGQRIGHDLAKQYGPVESSLFEVALKSNLLLLIYRPGTPTVDSVSAALQEAAVRAKLPEKLWHPLIQAINTQAPPKEVQAAIKKLHSDVEQYLASGVSPSGR